MSRTLFSVIELCNRHDDELFVLVHERILKNKQNSKHLIAKLQSREQFQSTDMHLKKKQKHDLVITIFFLSKLISEKSVDFFGINCWRS